MRLIASAGAAKPLLADVMYRVRWCRQNPLLAVRFIASSGAFYSVGASAIAPGVLALTRNVLACLVKGDAHVGKTAEYLDGS